MKLLKMKYKAHKLVNSIFYILIFVVGFLIGYGSKNIKIEDILSNILMINSVDAYSIPWGENGFKESDIIEKFVEKSDGTFDINKTPYITCQCSGGNASCIATDYKYFDSSYGNITISSSGGSWYKIANFNTYTGYYCHFMIGSSSGNLSDNSKINCSVEKEITSEEKWIVSKTPYDTRRGIWTNYKAEDKYIKGTNNLSNTNGFNTLDFSKYIIKNYMKIDYLNENYEVLSSTYCNDNTSDYCNFEINSNLGSYIKITYYLKDLLGENIDLLNNNVYQLRTKIKGLTEDTLKDHYVYWYYFNDSTSNIDSEFIYPISKTKYKDNDTYVFNTTFRNLTDYETMLMYEFDIFYKTNKSEINTISIPYTFLLGIQGSNLDDLESSQMNNQQTIIDQNQTNIDNNNKINDKLDDINSSIKDDNIDGSSDIASGFFNNFEDNDYGLNDIITMPLELVKDLTNCNCTPLNIELPYVKSTITIPCLNEIYEKNFPAFMLFYNLIIHGMFSYWGCVQTYEFIKAFKDPDKDMIEVIDL